MQPDSIQHRRAFTRIPFEIQAQLDTFPGKHVCDLIDISLKGALVRMKSDWQGKTGAACCLHVKLGDAEQSINMTGEIAHIEGRHLGIRCMEIDLDSITNLRRLIELNLGDEAMLAMELAAMMHPGSSGNGK